MAKSPNHGGKRPGAGRKPSTTRTAMADLRDKILQAEGIKPLEAIVENMRYYWEKAIADAPRPGGDTPDPLFWRQLAEESAAKAAVFVHPRLSSVEAKVEGEVSHAYVSSEPPTEEEWLELYGRKDDEERSVQ